MTADYTIRLVIHGRVQGVWYRATARREATALGIDGWVRNLPDGTVETVAAGQQEALDRFVAWCGQGPPGANVTRVEHHPAGAEDLPERGTGFEVRR